MVEHAGWASCWRATSDLKHLAGNGSWLSNEQGDLVSHRGDGAAWPRRPHIDLHRTGMRAATVLIVAARRAAAGMHARRMDRITFTLNMTKSGTRAINKEREGKRAVRTQLPTSIQYSTARVPDFVMFSVNVIRSML